MWKVHQEGENKTKGRVAYMQGGSLNILKTIMENSVCEDPSTHDNDHQYVSLKGCTLMHCAAQG